MVKLKISLVIFFLSMTSGCVSDFNKDKTSEDALIALGDYNKLIKIYRYKLSEKENRSDRYKLALYYNKAGDYYASSYYLKNLLDSEPSSAECYLEAKNLNESGGEFLVTLERLKCATTQKPVINEAYNLYGVVYAMNGEYALANKNLNIARDKFVDEVQVTNNLAMVALMQNDFSLARNYLQPLHERGVLKGKGLYNLAYTYVHMNNRVLLDQVLNSLNVEEIDKPKFIREIKKTTIFKKEKS